jgi:hypothetical protein
VFVVEAYLRDFLKAARRQWTDPPVIDRDALIRRITELRSTLV